MSRAAAPVRADFRYWQRFTTRWADNDAYGHVNNTVYYQWFDSLVNQWLIERDLLDIGQGDPIALVVATDCQFFSSTAYPGQIDAGLAATEVGSSSVRYRIGIFAAGDENAAAAGHFVHVAVTRTGRRPTPWPDAWRVALRDLLI
ncbi:thioesterase family protein [Sphingomonas swuensis]|uniref:Thioesterase family protein n=1 Tax=Sphingomonas swuensis TaxID=977800 RepID=A0ABP7SY46_9SPHN